MQKDPIRILLAEDNPDDARWVREALASSRASPFQLAVTHRLDVTLERLEGRPFDLILLSLDLPDHAGRDVFTQVSAAAPATPIIVLANPKLNRHGMAAVRAGAQDLLYKDALNDRLLLPTIWTAIEQHRMQQELGEMALLDAQSGLLNRQGFCSLADRQLRIAARNQNGLVLIRLQVEAPESRGGDPDQAEWETLLIAVARTLARTFRRSDGVGRLGEAEFAVAAIRTSRSGGFSLVSRLEESLYHVYSEHNFRFTLSLGYACYEHDQPGTTLSDLLAAAGARLVRRLPRKEAHPAPLKVA